MLVYFTASTTNDGQYKSQYQALLKQIKKLGHEISSGEQIINKELLEKDEQLGWDKVFAREKKAIEESDCIVAEVSSPSLGVGSEITYALTLDKPVLVMLYGETEGKLSPMIAGNPSQNLYTDHYDEDNLAWKLEQFFKHVAANENRKGKLIVIDGGDGAGKATQAKLLLDYLKSKKIPVKYVDFPRYYSSFHGQMVGRYLSGEFGNVQAVSPYLISLAYAVDRAGMRDEINDWLKNGCIVIANRYTTTSLAYMAAKFKKGKKREEFIEWLDELEYRIHLLPREDLLLYLDVPPKIGQKLVDQKEKRSYTKGKKRDIHEANLIYLEEVERVYLSLIKKKKNWLKINCLTDHQIKPIPVIHEEILKVLKERKII